MSFVVSMPTTVVFIVLKFKFSKYVFVILPCHPSARIQNPHKNHSPFKPEIFTKIEIKCSSKKTKPGRFSKPARFKIDNYFLEIKVNSYQVQPFHFIYKGKFSFVVV